MPLGDAVRGHFETLKIPMQVNFQFYTFMQEINYIEGQDAYGSLANYKIL
jgi:hypothetical protein